MFLFFMPHHNLLAQAAADLAKAKEGLPCFGGSCPAATPRGFAVGYNTRVCCKKKRPRHQRVQQQQPVAKAAAASTTSAAGLPAAAGAGATATTNAPEAPERSEGISATAPADALAGSAIPTAATVAAPNAESTSTASEPKVAPPWNCKVVDQVDSNEEASPEVSEQEESEEEEQPVSYAVRTEATDEDVEAALTRLLMEGLAQPAPPEGLGMPTLVPPEPDA